MDGCKAVKGTRARPWWVPIFLILRQAQERTPVPIPTWKQKRATLSEQHREVNRSVDCWEFLGKIASKHFDSRWCGFSKLGLCEIKADPHVGLPCLFPLDQGEEVSAPVVRKDEKEKCKKRIILFQATADTKRA